MARIREQISYHGHWTLMSIVLFSAISSFSPSSASATTFLHPVDSMTLTQSYSAFNVIGNGKYHAGFDIVSSTGSTTIKAVAAGTARVIPNGTFINQNHGLGNVIILDHGQGEGPSTLYAHLASFHISNGVDVTAGQTIATMGDTGCGDCGVHLHFEVKRWGVLGNLHDDLGPEWGYTPDLPNLYGYQNPWPYFDHDLESQDRVVVAADFSQIVRTGPNASEYTLEVDSVDQGQLFVAFQRHGDWYEVDLPSTEGPATGWISATAQSSTPRVEVDDPVRGTIGVNVRALASTSTSTVTNVWDDQWFTLLGTSPAGNGCSEEWHEIPLPNSAGMTTGWVCSEFLLVHDTPECFGLSLDHVGQGSDPVASPTESSGCAAGQYVSGEFISLTASPASGWFVESWSGTNDDNSTSTTNTVTMPATSHAVTVFYAEDSGPEPCSDDVYENLGSSDSDDSCFGAQIALTPGYIMDTITGLDWTGV